MAEKKHLKDKLNDISRPQLMTVLAWVVAAAVALVAGAFWAYFINFGPADFSKDPAVWGQFGDFIGGTANPLISTLALIAVVLTIVLQSKQLDISSQELNETRQELKRSSDAQELSARLNALTALFTEYRNLSEQKEAEFVRALSAPPVPGGSVALIEALKRERDGILATKYQIFSELEKLAGIQRAGAQPSAQADGPASGGSAA